MKYNLVLVLISAQPAGKPTPNFTIKQKNPKSNVLYYIPIYFNNYIDEHFLPWLSRITLSVK